MFATNSTRYLTNSIRHLDTHVSISNFERSVLGWIEAKFTNQSTVGMRDPSALKHRWKALDEIYKVQILLETLIFNCS